MGRPSVRCASPEVVSHMKPQKHGAIVMNDTHVTRKPFAGQGNYALLKDVLAVAAKYPACEPGVRGIRGNGIDRDVPTQAYVRQTAANYGMTEEPIIAPIASNIALAKLPTDDDGAQAARIPACDDANAATGATLAARRSPLAANRDPRPANREPRTANLRDFMS
nr:SDR family oxidoreductase [Burkholderia sp. BE12]